MDHLNEIDRIFKKYATDYHFYLRDLVNNKEYELGVKKNYPICSCFKLAVLMAFFDSLESEAQLDEEVIIQPKDFSPGGGIINYFTTPVKYTYFQLCQLMMAFSDGTATDILMDRVGLEKINYVLKRVSPNSNITMNIKEMVVDFQTRFQISDLKHAKTNSDYTFKDLTNAVDLNHLIWESYNFKPKNISQKIYLSCLDVKKLLPRVALFLNPNIKIIGKTGSIGHTFFANDCGVVIKDNQPLCTFGIASYGFKQDKDVVELFFGLIGLSILKLIGLDEKPGARYCEETRRTFV